MQVRLIPEGDFVVLRAPNFQPNHLIYRALRGEIPGVSARRSRFSLFFAAGSTEPDELLQAPEAGRQLLALGAHPAAPIGELHLADINVAAAVDGEPVR